MMKKRLCAALMLAFLLLLGACEFPLTDDELLQTLPTAQPDIVSPAEPSQDEEEPSPEVSKKPEIPEDTARQTEPPVEIPQETVEPSHLHSEFYLDDCTLEQITEYFEEVVLNIEYTDGTGDAHLVQKWLSPIYYGIYGSPTDTDLKVLNTLFEQLNAVNGFPGIYPATDDNPENVSLNFLDKDAFNESFSEIIQGEDAYGAVHFWYYTDTNELYTARIGYRTDIDQSIRNSVLIEEVINILGITDTVLRPDSITYQYSNDVTALSDEDMTILKLLYAPAIRCGMDAQSCEEVLKELYF